MSTTTCQINNIKIKPLKINAVDPDKVKGKDLFPEPYCNIFFCAKKKSGKTCTIWETLKRCSGISESGLPTEVIIFCSTVHRDKNWLAILENLTKRGIPHRAFTSLTTNGGANNLTQIIQSLDEDAAARLCDAQKKEKKLNARPLKFI